MMEQVIQAVRTMPSNSKYLGKSALTLENGTGGQRSLVASYKAERPFAVRPGIARIALVTRERFTSDGTGGDTETFTLSHDVVDAGSTADPVVAFEDGNPLPVDSVDYAANTVDLSDPGANSDLDVYYTVGTGDQTRLTIEKVAPKNTQEEVWTGDVGLLNARDQDKRPVTLDFDGSVLEPVVPRNWELRVYADGPYPVEWNDDGAGTVTGSTATNALLEIPINQGLQQIPQLGAAVRHDAAEK